MTNVNENMVLHLIEHIEKRKMAGEAIKDFIKRKNEKII